MCLAAAAIIVATATATAAVVGRTYTIAAAAEK